MRISDWSSDVCSSDLRRRRRADRRAARVSRAMATLRVRCESWPIRGTFTISRGSKTTADVVVVELSDTDGNLQRGDAGPYANQGQFLQLVLVQKIGRASGRERGCKELYISGTARPSKKKTQQ